MEQQSLENEIEQARLRVKECRRRVVAEESYLFQAEERYSRLMRKMAQQILEERKDR